MEKRLFVPQELIPALLDGSKTMHRVVLRPQPKNYHDCSMSINGTVFMQYGKIFDYSVLPFQDGDLLWVPEKWCKTVELEPEEGKIHFHYKATPDNCTSSVFNPDTFFNWRSPVTMPREAARIWLEVVSVKVERLQSIKEEDARAEGIIDGGCINCGEHEPCGCDNPQPDARDGYIWFWNAHAKPGHGWDANDWVEAVTFRRVDHA